MSSGRVGAACVLSSLVAGTLLAGCGSSGASHGTVSVLYAGSLVNTMEHDLGPAFARAQGYGYEGVGAGSSELVAQIKDGIRRGDVFVSASPKADADLEGAAEGGWVSWYVAFARAPLVIGYDPHSRFGALLRSEPWYRAIVQPGVRVGATDPRLDPKGRLTVATLRQAAAALRMPSLARVVSSLEVFPEESLVGRLQAGQLDAGFFYANEAREQGIPAVGLSPAKAAATYTVTILKGAPDPRGARAFVSFLLGSAGRAILRRHGLTVLRPALSGPASAVPAPVRALLASLRASSALRAPPSLRTPPAGS